MNYLWGIGWVSMFRMLRYLIQVLRLTRPYRSNFIRYHSKISLDIIHKFHSISFINRCMIHSLTSNLIKCFFIRDLFTPVHNIVNASSMISSFQFITYSCTYASVDESVSEVTIRKNLHVMTSMNCVMGFYAELMISHRANSSLVHIVIAFARRMCYFASL